MKNSRSQLNLFLSPKFLHWPCLVIILSITYWSYLALTSQTIIFHDSIGYRNTAQMFYEGRWKEFFITGPGREPIYSLFIALCMRIANLFHFDYLAVVVCFQTFILAATQMMLYAGLRRMGMKTLTISFILLYTAISPNLTTSGLILFSEIITYPLVLWVLFRLAQSWVNVTNKDMNTMIKDGLLTGLALLLITFTKGIFELLSMLFLVPFFLKFTLLSVGPAILKQKNAGHIQARKIGLFLLITLLTFHVPITVYKFINKKYNNIYTLTDRGPTALYGITAQRMLPLNAERFTRALLFIPGGDVCSRVFGKSCDQWGYLPGDILASQRNTELRASGLNSAQVNKQLLQESVLLAVKNPFQYTAMTILESFKSLFWEAPQMSYLVLAQTIDQTYQNPWLRYPLRFFMALCTLMTLIYSCFFLWRVCPKFNLKWLSAWLKSKNESTASDINNKELALSPSTDLNRHATLLFCSVMVITYIGLQSIFYITARYMLMIVPLLLILFADRLNSVFRKTN